LKFPKSIGREELFRFQGGGQKLELLGIPHWGREAGLLAAS
jgi:hypothetical protein